MLRLEGEKKYKARSSNAVSGKKSNYKTLLSFLKRFNGSV